jgi:hypothetical protein
MCVGMGRLTAYVNCPIKVLGVYGYYATGQELVPEGCVLGSVMTGEPNLCTAASPVACQCNPLWPAGMYATPQVPFAWRPFNFSSRAAGTVFNFKSTGSLFSSFLNASNSTVVNVSLTANNMMPPGSVVVIRNLRGGDDRGRGVNLSFFNCGGFVNITKVGQWEVDTGTLRFTLEAPTASLLLNFSVFGNVNAVNWSAAVDPPALYSPFYWLTASYASVEGAQTRLSFCLLANTLLPPGTAVTIRNLKGMAASNTGAVQVTSSVFWPTGILDASSESLRVVTRNVTYALSFSVTVNGPVSASFAAAEAAPDALNEALYANVTITTTPMQRSVGAGCDLKEGPEAILGGVARVGTQRLLRWTPRREQAGRTYSVCMRLAALAGPVSALRCFKIKVPRPA